MFLPSSHIEVLDQHFAPKDNLMSFATTNALLKIQSTIDYEILNFWMLDQTMILGLKDQRLPELSNALSFLSDHDYHYFVRNSGGLGVISDSGVLNVSLFIPDHLASMSVDDAYQKMTDLVRFAFPELTIETGEVVHSYCPGTFDLSVNGQKIGGMAQRRNPDGTVIMAYLSINGDQQQRGEIVQTAYKLGLADHENKWHFPDVDPASMINIQSLLTAPLSIAEVKNRFIEALQHQQLTIGDQQLNTLMQQPQFLSDLSQERTQMMTRQSKIGGQK